MITKHYCSKCGREFATYKECADHEEKCKAFKVYGVVFLNNMTPFQFFSSEEKAKAWIKSKTWTDDAMVHSFVVDEVEE